MLINTHMFASIKQFTSYLYLENKHIFKIVLLQVMSSEWGRINVTHVGGGGGAWSREGAPGCSMSLVKVSLSKTPDP